jgi:hypothetical protein
MGLEWDPEGWWLTIVVVIAALGFIGKLVYQYQLEKARKEAMFRGQ